MEYILSFLIYLLISLLGGIVLISLISILMIVLNLFLKEKIKIKKILLTFSIIYLVGISIFYIDRANDYLFEDRAYKEAKAYAITGEYLSLWQAPIVNILSMESIFLKPITYLQKVILGNIRRNIPKEDAEYEIWNYKFNLMMYARSLYAPVTDESKKRGLAFTRAAASMKSEILDIMNNILNSMDSLDKNKIKDKEFNKIDKYLVISAMDKYYVQYYFYFADLNSNTKEKHYHLKRVLKFWNTEKYKKQFKNYLSILDNVNKAIKEDKILAKAFDKYPSLKASFYWGSVRGYMDYYSGEVYKDIYPCTNENFLKFVQYYKDYVNWAYMTSSSSFKTLSKREKGNYDFMVENNGIDYYVAKYICKIPFKYMIKREKNIRPKYREKNFRYSMEHRKYIKQVRKLEKEFKERKTNGK